MSEPTVVPKYRLGLLRFLNRKAADEWFTFDEMLTVGTGEGIMTADDVAWWHVARRECVALGEVDVRFVRGEREVRLTEHGRQVIAIEEELRPAPAGEEGT